MQIEIYLLLEEKGVVNGCGAKWYDNFDALIKTITSLSYFNHEKGKDLDLRIKLEVCGPHDVDYEDGGTWIDKLFADLLFCIRFYRLLDWTDWKIRYFVVIPWLIAIFREFQKGGKKVFKYREKSI